MFKLFVLIFLLASVKSRRISEEKCQEYKDMLKETQCVGFSVFDACPSRIDTYECFDVRNTGLIVGGEEAKPGEFPHMAALGWQTDDGNLAFQCGGSLISDRFVLTAAHCGSDRDTGREPVLVRLGVQNLAIDGPSLVESKIKRFIKHPAYNSIHEVNDIALIELEEAVKFDRKLLRPACLQQEEYFEPNVTAIGWGQTSTYGPTTDVLMKVPLPVVNVDICKFKFTNDLLDGSKQICAGGVKGKDTCKGDSGAPIQRAHLDAPCVYNIIGLTSIGPPRCGQADQYSIYTRTLHYLDWIESVVWPQPEVTTTTRFPSSALPRTTSRSRLVKNSDWN